MEVKNRMLHNVYQIQDIVFFLYFSYLCNKCLHTSTLWGCVDLSWISANYLSQIHLFFHRAEKSVNTVDCFQVIFGVTPSVSPTYWCYHMSCASLGSWFLLVVCLFHDNLVAHRMLCRNSWCYAKIWKPQIYKRGRLGLTTHILHSLNLIQYCLNPHTDLCQI